MTDLLQQLDPALTATLSKAVATKVLTHPLVSGSNTPMSSDATVSTGWWATALGRVRHFAGGPRLGNVIHREEFTKLLMGLATADGPKTVATAENVALTRALTSNGIPNPDATLKNIKGLRAPARTVTS